MEVFEATIKANQTSQFKQLETDLNKVGISNKLKSEDFANNIVEDTTWTIVQFQTFSFTNILYKRSLQVKNKY